MRKSQSRMPMLLPRNADTGPRRCRAPGCMASLRIGGRRIAQLVAIMMFSVVSGAVSGRPQVNSGFGDFFSRCTAITVLVCLPLDSAAEIDRYRSTPKYLDPADWIQWDQSMHAARFTIPPHSGTD